MKNLRHTLRAGVAAIAVAAVVAPAGAATSSIDVRVAQADGFSRVEFRGGPDAQVVNRDRHGGKAHGREEVEGDGVTGILDDHPVGRGEPGGEDPLDAVERAAGDGQAGGIDAVGGQLAGRQAAQSR